MGMVWVWSIGRGMDYSGYGYDHNIYCIITCSFTMVIIESSSFT
jgi:hypothetical protein